MATDTFKNGTESDYAADGSWTGGAAPVAGDTAVISSAGDPPATIATATNIYEDQSGDSIADATSDPVAIPFPIVVYNDTSSPPIEFVYDPDVTPDQTRTPGDIVAGQTIDMIGAGSVAALFLQNSTLAADTTVNVSGVAAFGSQFTNTLGGTIDIGLPFSVNGVPVTAPPADSIGTINELDINVRPTGSWTLANDGTYTLSGYVPGVTNTGQIEVGADSALRVQLHGGPGGLLNNGFNVIYDNNPSASSFTNNGTILVDAGGTAAFYETASPPGLAAPYEQVVNNGDIFVNGAAGQNTTFFSQAAFSRGFVQVQGGTAAAAATVAEFAGNVFATSFSINNATLQFDVATNLAANVGIANPGQFSGGTVVFFGTGGVLSLGTNSSNAIYPTELDTMVGNFTCPINNFAAGDAIDLTFAFGASSSILAEGTFTFQTIYTQSTRQLQIQETVVPPFFFSDRTPQTAIIASLTLDGIYNPSSFSVAYPSTYSENENITLVVTTTTPAPCFAAGTLIATPDGDRPVEDLRPGDLVLRHPAQTPAPVAWVGHRRVDCTADPRQAPIRIRAGALGPNTPRRDLLVSPDHALFLEGVLVPAELLVDGDTIRRDAASSVTYHHVELETHAILLAEGAPAESYLDTGNRARFGNCPLAYDPVEAAANDPCAEVLFGGPRLAAIRARLAEGQGRHARACFARRPWAPLRAEPLEPII